MAEHLQIFSHWVYIGSWSATGAGRPLEHCSINCNKRALTSSSPGPQAVTGHHFITSGGVVFSRSRELIALTSPQRESFSCSIPSVSGCSTHLGDGENRAHRDDQNNLTGTKCLASNDEPNCLFFIWNPLLWRPVTLRFNKSFLLCGATFQDHGAWSHKLIKLRLQSSQA